MAAQQYLEILQSDGLPLNPDAVLVGVYIGNDIREDPPRGFFSPNGSRALMVAKRVYQVIRLGRLPGRDLRFESMFRIEADGTRTELPLQTVEKHRAREWKHLRRLFHPPPDRETERAWRDTERALREIVALCRERGIAVYATLAPDRIQVDDDLLEAVAKANDRDPADFDPRYPNRRLQALFESGGVPVLDLTPALRDAQRTGLTYHRRGVHWNRYGNAAVADVLAPWLARQLDTAAEAR